MFPSTGQGADGLDDHLFSWEPNMTPSLADWLDILRCPVEGAKLQDEARALGCPSCGAKYPHEGGIVRFIEADGAPALDSELKQREMQARDADADDYDTLFDERTLSIELPPSLEALARSAADVVCELGAGTGRFT